MSTKQDHINNVPTSYEVSIAIHDDRKKPNSNQKSSKYKRFDKESRNRVIFWIHLTIFFVAIGLCVASFSFSTLQKARLKGIAMWQWCLLLAALLCGPVLSRAIVRFILIFIDIDFSVKENVIYYVVGLIKSAWVMLWFSMILVAWLWVVDEPRFLGMPREDTIKIKQMYGTTYHIVTVTLVTFILGSFLWLVKDFFLMKAKSSFHIRRFFDRIKLALYHQYVIDLLLAPERGVDQEEMNRFQENNNTNVGEVLRYVRDEGLDKIGLGKENKERSIHMVSSHVYKETFHGVGLGRKKKRVIDLSRFEDVSQENVSCWGMKILIQAIIDSPNLTYKDNKNGNGSTRFKYIDCEEEAIEAANVIFSTVVHGTDRSNIGRQELISKYFSHECLDEVKKCLLEGAGGEQIGKDVFKKWMVKAYKYHEALARALQANKEIFHTFSRFVDVLLVFFIFALWLIMIRVETRKVIFLIGSAIVGSAFIFGDTSKKLLDNVLFVFLVHPFDIGDCCLIEETPVIIKEINILTTVVLKFNKEIKHYPNSILANQSISNYSRSPYMGDLVVLTLGINTPNATINILKERIMSYIKEKPQYWSPEHHWEMELEDMAKIKMALHIQHTINSHEFIERQIRKSELVLQIKDTLEDLKLIDSNTTPC